MEGLGDDDDDDDLDDLDDEEEDDLDDEDDEEDEEDEEAIGDEESVGERGSDESSNYEPVRSSAAGLSPSAGIEALSGPTSASEDEDMDMEED
mmetsp:Transcript_26757/g.85968  ORF Transcript_26757/g.85968 Transcript_26757/m.85968 type:complete len:93 (-) Transcript_26757:248-526(-)